MADWVSVASCEATAQFGWLVGVATGALADIVIVALIASAPRLGARRVTRVPPAPHARRARRARHAGHAAPPGRGAGLRLWTQGLIALAVGSLWLGGGYLGRAFAACYVPTLAYGAALTTGVVLAVVMVTAANQIGARSVR